MSFSISTPSNRIYLAGHPDDEDFASVARALRDREWDVRNTPADLRRDMRHQASVMLGCQAVCFLYSWWNSAEANMLQILAGWTKTKVISCENFEVLTDAKR